MRDFGFEPSRFSETKQLIQYIFDFKNGYSAIVNENFYAAYNYNEPLFEIYVTDNVYNILSGFEKYNGYKTQEEVSSILKEINTLKAKKVK